MVTIQNGRNLAEKLADEFEKDTPITVDEFFDKNDVPEYCRTDFVFACIAKQALEVLKERKNVS